MGKEVYMQSNPLSLLTNVPSLLLTFSVLLPFLIEIVRVYKNNTIWRRFWKRDEHSCWSIYRPRFMRATV